MCIWRFKIEFLITLSNSDFDYYLNLFSFQLQVMILLDIINKTNVQALHMMNRSVVGGPMSQQPGALENVKYLTTR